MYEVTKKLIRTVGITATKCGFTLFTSDLATAGGTHIGYAIGDCIFTMRYHTKYLGDNITGLADDDSVTDADAFLIDEILVVKCRSADSCTS